MRSRSYVFIIVVVLSSSIIGYAQVTSQSTAAIAISDVTGTIERHTNFQEYFKLTDHSLARLREKELPPIIISELERLKNREYRYVVREKFFDDLENIIGRKPATQYKSLISDFH